MFPQSESETEGLLLSWSGRECTCTGARAIQPRRACGSFLRGEERGVCCGYARGRSERAVGEINVF
jgi:hypothetical protein